jgi:ankyrin repeat protein
MNLFSFFKKSKKIGTDLSVASIQNKTISTDELIYPLHIAVSRGDEEKVRQFLEQGIETSNLDNLGNTPLHWAAFGGDFQIAELLVKYGAEVNAIARDGVSPLWRAEDFGFEDIVELLRQHGGKSIAT